MYLESYSVISIPLLTIHFVCRVVPVEERESKYNRLISATLLSTSYLLNNLSQDDVNSLSSEIQDILEEKKFWKFSKHKSAMVWISFTLNT